MFSHQCCVTVGRCTVAISRVTLHTGADAGLVRRQFYLEVQAKKIICVIRTNKAALQIIFLNYY